VPEPDDPVDGERRPCSAGEVAGQLPATPAPGHAVVHPPRPRTRAIATLSGAHFINDQYGNYLPILLPVLAEHLGLSLAAAGVLMMVLTASSSLPQLFFGWLADRVGGRFIAGYALLLSACGSAFMAVGGTFATVAAWTLVHGLGTSAFHPQTGATVTRIAGRHRATAMSLYVMCGQAGYAISPLAAATVVGLFGLEWLWVLVLPGVVAGFFLQRMGPAVQEQAPREPVALSSALRDHGRDLGIVITLVIARSTLYSSFLLLLPFLYRARGLSSPEAAALIAAMVAAGAIGGIAGGLLADRIGRHWVIRGSFLLSAPLFVAAVHADGALGHVSLVAGGAVLLGSFSILTVQAQRLLPSHAASATGLVLGVSLGIGGLMAGPAALAAESFGMVSVLTVVAILPAAASLLVRRLAEAERPSKPRTTSGGW
jgi:MFS transporter, FSR family, fosmidomycin resistance protein